MRNKLLVKKWGNKGKKSYVRVFFFVRVVQSAEVIRGDYIFKMRGIRT